MPHSCAPFKSLTSVLPASPECDGYGEVERPGFQPPATILQLPGSTATEAAAKSGSQHCYQLCDKRAELSAPADAISPHNCEKTLSKYNAG